MEVLSKIDKRILILNLLKNKNYDLLYECIKNTKFKYSSDKYHVIFHLIKEKEKDQLIKFCPILNINQKCILPLWELIHDVDFFKNLRLNISTKLINKIIELEMIELFNIIIKSNLNKISNILCLNIEKENIKNIKFILKFIYQFNNLHKINITHKACKINNLEILILLNENQILYQSILFIKKYNCNFKYFIENNLLDKKNSKILFYTIQSQNLKIIKLLFDKNFAFECNYLVDIFGDTILDFPNFKLIKFLVEKGVRVDNQFLFNSILKSYEITKFLLRNINFSGPLFFSEQIKVFKCGNMKAISDFLDLGFLEIHIFKEQCLLEYSNYLEYRLNMYKNDYIN